MDATMIVKFLIIAFVEILIVSGRRIQNNTTDGRVDEISKYYVYYGAVIIRDIYWNKFVEHDLFKVIETI